MDLLLVFHTFLFLSFFLSALQSNRLFISVFLSLFLTYNFTTFNLFVLVLLSQFIYSTFLCPFLVSFSLSFTGKSLVYLCFSLRIFFQSVPVLNSTSFCLYFYQSLFTSPFYVRFWSLLVYFIFARLYFSQLAFLNILQLMLRCK